MKFNLQCTEFGNPTMILRINNDIKTWLNTLFDFLSTNYKGFNDKK